MSPHPALWWRHNRFTFGLPSVGIASVSVSAAASLADKIPGKLSGLIFLVTRGHSRLVEKIVRKPLILGSSNFCTEVFRAISIMNQIIWVTTTVWESTLVGRHPISMEIVGSYFVSDL